MYWANNPPCTLEGCEQPRRSRGLCDMHYQRWRKTGDPGPAASKKNVPFWGRVSIGEPDECWPFDEGAQDGFGYGLAWFNQRRYRAHVLAWEFTYNRSVPTGWVIRHRCDNPPCCNPAHLQLGTHADNIRDMVQRGRHRGVPGEANGHAKFTEADVRAIRKGYSQGVPCYKLAKEYQRPFSTINDIIHRRKWRHI